MGFTNVAWESRDGEQLARDLTDGPRPVSVGQAGGAFVRVANELADISADYVRIVVRIRIVLAGRGGDAAAGKLDEFGQWLKR
jgi:hypothetical protein